VPVQISVTDPVKQGDGFGSYISYKINTRTSLPQYTWKEFSQIHRYSDFVWLHNQLKARYPNVIIPPLPEKALTGNYDPNFISLRRHALER
jgi:sorting nexin-1/2